MLKMCQQAQSHIFFLRKTSEKYYCVKKTKAIGKAEYPKTAGNYGTLHISQLAGL